jgi:predicted nucleotide-binding protein
MRTLLLLEDDVFLAQAISETLCELGVTCSKFSNVRAIEKRLRGAEPDALVVDLAIPLNGSKLVTNEEARSGFHAGQSVLRYAKQHWPSAAMALITGRPCDDVRRWCASNSIEYFIKPVERSTLERFLGFRSTRAFVVHGRNTVALRMVKSVLEALRIEPVVLMECASLGRTVIEKCEEVSSSCDCAIVIVSPDDVGRLAGTHKNSELFRTRQNVLFELGYFYGALGRRSGLVVLVEYGDVEIPSDLGGVIRIDGKVTKAKLRQTLAAELAPVLRRQTCPESTIQSTEHGEPQFQNAAVATLPK